ncbi:MAG TPA: SDR family NAD(P)-dependent oxidoreductase, partial [Reyranella sp.]|nr:SDR family NAD(P)-dependent oxidoreductase [Reyranella sp.]
MSSKVALITGSTSGIGAATARRLAKDGYIVALHSSRSVEAGQQMAAELGGSASYHQADLADDASARTLVAS